MFQKRTKTSVVIFLLLYLPFTHGCGYGEVSPKTYELAKALYNISNRKLDDKLADVKLQIAEELGKEEISKQEANWLNEIVERAERQEWGNAMKSARRMMEDQVAK